MSSYLDRFQEEINRIGVSAVSDHLGVARNTVYNWMGKANIPLNYLVALQGLGVDVLYVIDDKRSGDSLSADEHELLDLFRSASRAGKAAAIGALQGVSGMTKSVSQQINAPVSGGVAGRDLVNNGRKKKNETGDQQ